MWPPTQHTPTLTIRCLDASDFLPIFNKISVDSFPRSVWYDKCWRLIFIFSYLKVIGPFRYHISSSARNIKKYFERASWADEHLTMSTIDIPWFTWCWCSGSVVLLYVNTRCSTSRRHWYASDNEITNFKIQQPRNLLYINTYESKHFYTLSFVSNQTNTRCLSFVFLTNIANINFRLPVFCLNLLFCQSCSNNIFVLTLRARQW